MLKIFIYPFSIALILLFLVFTSFSCAEEDSSDIVFAGYHVEKSNAGLQAWNIDLATDTLAYSRNVEFTRTYNPPHWIVLTDSECIGVGIPDATKNNCPFGEQDVVGLAVLETAPLVFGYEQGEIINTTIMIRESIHNDMSAEEVRSIYTHEIGHALGLSHTDAWKPEGNEQYVMFPDTSGADIPCQDELDVIRYVYGGLTIQDPSANGENVNCVNGTALQRDYSEYFIRIDGDYPSYIRNKPLFNIYPYFSPSNSSLSLSVEPPKPGKKLGFTPNVVKMYYYKNGDFKEEYIDGSGKIIRSKYIKAGKNHSK